MVIDVKNISLTIKKQKILDNVSLSCEEGKIYGLVGRNGSGKTMLMKCICGFIRPDEGETTVLGKKIGKDCDFAPDTGIIIETPGFIGHYSGFKNLKLLAGINRKINDDKIREVMEFVGLDPKMKKSVRKYSLGMRQRLGLAQAIMEDPKVLILDEPMNGLDKNGVNDMRELLLRLKTQERLIILASHNPADIEILCDVVYEMDNGKIVAEHKMSKI